MAPLLYPKCLFLIWEPISLSKQQKNKQQKGTPEGAPLIKMCRSKSLLFRYNCRKNCQLASAKLTVFCFILTKNRRILSALQFLLSYFIRISEKKDFAYLPYSWAFFSLRRMKEQRKNRHLFIEGAPRGALLAIKDQNGTMRRSWSNQE